MFESESEMLNSTIDVVHGSCMDQSSKNAKMWYRKRVLCLLQDDRVQDNRYDQAGEGGDDGWAGFLWIHLVPQPGELQNGNTDHYRPDVRENAQTDKPGSGRKPEPAST